MPAVAPKTILTTREGSGPGKTPGRILSRGMTREELAQSKPAKERALAKAVTGIVQATVDTAVDAAVETALARVVPVVLAESLRDLISLTVPLHPSPFGLIGHCPACHDCGCSLVVDAPRDDLVADEAPTPVSEVPKEPDAPRKGRKRPETPTAPAPDPPTPETPDTPPETWRCTSCLAGLRPDGTGGTREEWLALGLDRSYPGKRLDSAMWPLIVAGLEALAQGRGAAFMSGVPHAAGLEALAAGRGACFRDGVRVGAVPHADGLGFDLTSGESVRLDA